METTSGSKLNLNAAIAGAFAIVALIFAINDGNWYLIFKTIHVTFVVIWVGGGMFLTILALLAQRTQNPTELATVARQAAWAGEKLFSRAAIVVLAAGVAMMINGSLDWGKFWVSFGLLGFASTFIVGIGILAPRSKKIVELTETIGVEAPETQAAIASLLVIARYDIAVLLLVVLDMVLKPFS